MVGPQEHDDLYSGIPVNTGSTSPPAFSELWWGSLQISWLSRFLFCKAQFSLPGVDSFLQGTPKFGHHMLKARASVFSILSKMSDAARLAVPKPGSCFIQELKGRGYTVSYVQLSAQNFAVVGCPRFPGCSSLRVDSQLSDFKHDGPQSS